MRVQNRETGEVVSAVLIVEHPSSSYGIPVLEVMGPDGMEGQGVAYSPAEAAWLFALVSASKEERDELVRYDYLDLVKVEQIG